MPSANTIESFWNRVDRRSRDECWEWQGNIAKVGYGEFSYHCRKYHAHRFAYILTYGDIPNSYYVCHKCDNRKCCNPNHLWLGTHADNQRDMSEKGRAATGDKHGSKTHPDSVQRGESNHSSKLNWEQVRAIRESFANGVKQSDLARQYGLDKTTIGAIVHNHTWRED
jgi:hypothetical protein